MLIAFHLGRVYTLSLAELLAVFQQKGIVFEIKELHTEVLIIETPFELDLESLQKRLGGIVKIMQVVDTLPRKKPDDYLSFTLKDYFHPNIIKSHFFKPAAGKAQFGISVYPLTDKVRLFGQNKRIGMEIKKSLQEAGISCRLVIPEGSTLALPSVAVTNNLLLQKGAEIDFLVTTKKIYIAKTASVQDFADYGRRDYQRPVRDARVGMLPPKVAQIMINLAQIPEEARTRGDFLLDPFCGSGTVLQEAMLTGYHVLGTDMSEKAIDAAEKNLSWFRTRYKLPPSRFEVIVSPVQELKQNVVGKNIAGIVTEGTLGPAYTEPPPEREIEKNFKELAPVYEAAFTQFADLVPAGAKIVVALPAYHRQHGYISFPVVDKILKLGYSIHTPISADLMSKYPFLRITPRNSIIYDRKDQIVVREIIIFEKH